MKALDLYKFIKENNIEYHCIEESEDVVIFVINSDLTEWNELLGSSILDADGLKCIMKDGYLCFQMKDICEHFDIELSEVFEEGR